MYSLFYAAELSEFYVRFYVSHAKLRAKLHKIFQIYKSICIFPQQFRFPSFRIPIWLVFFIAHSTNSTYFAIKLHLSKHNGIFLSKNLHI